VGDRATLTRNWALTLRDVKNEDRSGDVYENKGRATKCTAIFPAFYMKMHQWHDNRLESVRLFGGNGIIWTVIQGEDGPQSAHGPVIPINSANRFDGSNQAAPSWD
jgi:hypothetical protein